MITPLIAVNTIIKESLMKDFCEALSTQMILQNIKKCHLTLANFDKEGYIELVDSIISDYKSINPLGNDKTVIKKREWLSFIDLVEWPLRDESEFYLAYSPMPMPNKGMNIHYK